MNKVTSVILKPLEGNKYITPLTMHFIQNGVKKTYDCLASRPAVAVIIYNITRQAFVFVKQFRPAVYLGKVSADDRSKEIDLAKYPADLGITLEFCGGLVDKDIPLKNIAAEEVLEECGYKVSPEMLELVSNFISGVGRSAAPRSMFYCEVTDAMKVHEGGGVDDEVIEVVEMTVPEVKKYFLSSINSPPGVMAGVYWFLHHKYKSST